MIGWPVATELQRYLIHLRGVVYPKDVEAFGGILSFIAWGFVAFLLYEGQEKANTTQPSQNGGIQASGTPET